MECPKVQCVDDERRIGEEKSRLESLPEKLLLHILSFLSTEDAVKTSILSKGLQYAWTSVPSLTFSFPMDSKRSRIDMFRNFVERVLMLRDFSTLQKFSLSFEFGDRVSLWITAAVRRRVQEVYLHFDLVKHVAVLPSCLFSCETLRVLDLEAYFIVELPPSVHLPSLKIMKLLNFRFADGDSTEQLFSGCPVLEELLINECPFEKLKAVGISCPQLQSLSIQGNFELQRETVAQVTIFAPNLKSFAYTGDLFHQLCLFNSFSLVDATFDIIHEGSNHRETAYHACKLLRDFLTLQRLRISDGTLQILGHIKEYIVNIPMFANLTSLEIDGLAQFDRAPLLELLQHMPRLINIAFISGFGLGGDCDEFVWKFRSVPRCFLTHLETIKFSYFHGRKDELLLIKLLLQDAMVLKTLAINYGACVLQDHRMVEEQLRSFPKGSPSCKIIFECVSFSVFSRK